MTNILVCDDEKDIVNAMKIYLEAEDYNVYTAFNGEQAVKTVLSVEIHLIIMDIMMPVMDGIQAMTRIREQSNVPVILLTAKGEDSDKVLGLNLGADDYVTKPFTPIELMARVRSQLRRYMKLGGTCGNVSVLTIGDISLNDDSKEVTAAGEPKKLTPTEYDILKLFMEHPGKVFSTREIYLNIRKEAMIGTESSIAVHIRHLREKLEIDPTEPRYIKVVWGQGYKIEGEGK